MYPYTLLPQPWCGHAMLKGAVQDHDMYVSYICMYVHAIIQMCVCVYARMYAACMYTCICEYMFVYICMYVCMHLCMYVSMHACMCVTCMHVSAYIHI